MHDYVRDMMNLNKGLNLDVIIISNLTQGITYKSLLCMANW